MGWLFLPECTTRAELVAHLRRPERFGENLELARACVVGSHHWYLVRHRESGMHWIGLDLLSSARRRMGWGYKDLDETVGPCAVDCPISYLDAPHAKLEGWAAQWRERVRAYHATKKARPKPAPGLVVKLCDWTYTLEERAGARRGWTVTRSDGLQFRMKAGQLARAEFVSC
jgi:hypothetical protein